MIIKESVKIGDKTVTIETGRIAKQAHGSVVISCGETMLLVTVCGTREPRPGIDFFPLSCDFIEKMYAGGKIPGGFFKREGQLREHEILTSRVIDRPLRPLFPEGYRNEVQVVATVISVDQENPSDALALTGASAALHLSPIPWGGPVAGVRVGRVDGKFVANPTHAELEQSDCDIIVAASRDAIVMVEGELEELSEAELNEALWFGHKAVQDVIGLIEKLREAVGAQKWSFEAPKRDANIDKRVREVALADCKAACSTPQKHERYDKHKVIKKKVVETLAPEFPEKEGDLKAAYEDLKYEVMRTTIVDEGKRVDGRDTKTVRPIAIEAGWIPRTHGSALFTRGETQAIVTTTLGTTLDEQKIERLEDSFYRHFMLHYNFPAYSVGEVKPMRGPGRREVGHGNLAYRAIEKILPTKEEFPYTIRI
ncbi:MAG: polyribonucleotide nucleotidyltransferase, partial [Myxococcales bacterium]|nr:polyribonucleotide nucleotidyltransferase [Myxococcales bacterium]